MGNKLTVGEKNIIDSDISNDELEYYTKENVAVFVYGLLIRINEIRCTNFKKPENAVLLVSNAGLDVVNGFYELLESDEIYGGRKFLSFRKILPNGTVYNGHQRGRVLLYGSNEFVEVDSRDDGMYAIYSWHEELPDYGVSRRAKGWFFIFENYDDREKHATLKFSHTDLPPTTGWSAEGVHAMHTFRSIPPRPPIIEYL